MIVTEEHNASQYFIGNKAKGLLRLKRWGYRVPDFFCLPYEALKGIEIKNDKYVSLPGSLTHQIFDLLSKWDWKQEGLAVRSSFGAEDGTTHGFAGLFETFLNIKTEDELQQAIVAVVRSAHSQRVRSYLKGKNISTALLPAVIIQKQIHPEFSGVIFSKNPEYPEEIAIHMVEGLGDHLVAGRLSPVEYYLKRDSTDIVHKVIPEEFERLASNILKGSILKKLFDATLDMEQKIGCAADIEFCVKGNQLFILQVRPVTVSIPEIILYDNSNIQESYCGVTTPLTFSFAQRAYATVYKQTMKVLGLPESTIREHEAVVNNLLGLVKGRIYYNIKNWYKGLLLLPSFSQNKKDMERMMGLEDPVEFIDPKPKSIWEKIRIAPRLILNLLRLMNAFRKLDTSVKQFQQKFNAYYSGFYNKNLNVIASDQLWNLKNELDERILQNWTTPIINDFYVMMKHGSALRSMEGLDAEIKLKQKTLGQANLASLLPAIEMQSLADKVKSDPSLKNLIETVPLGQLVDKINTDFPEFQENVENYIRKYGDRTVGELKLETKTMRTHPETFYIYLKNLIDSERKIKINRNPENNIPGKVRKLQKGIRNRETLRLDRTKLFGMYRSIFLALGDKFYSEDILQHPRDIFYLTENEIEAIIGGQNAAVSLIEQRKSEGKVWEDEYVPSRVKIPSREYNRPPEITDQDQLRGQVCQAGEVTGVAIVIKRPEDDLNVKGRIVCALRTDPGWATLFPSCSAVLIEKGSTLSHSAILLREMGIPSIINIPGLTDQVKTGDQLEVNAHTGLIKIL